MTELYAICKTFEIPLARLFLPDRHQDIPTINDTYFHAVWNACFSKTDRYLGDWQLVEQSERHPPDSTQELGLDDQTASVYRALRHATTPSSENRDGDGSESP